ncbi:MAG: protein translocase subunit SecF [Parcubacteria group bacterium]|nr:protein translocase subunit SecF [Parcubacteria group bacterium]
MSIIKYKKIFFVFSALIVAFSLFAIFFWGLNPSIEFTGGTIIEVHYKAEPPTAEEISSVLPKELFGIVLIQPTNEAGFIIRTKDLRPEDRVALFDALSFNKTQQFTEERYSLVGPSIGAELRAKAWIAILIVLLGIILFVAFAFRKVSQGSVESVRFGASSWHYSVAALIALAHDIIIPTGIFAFLGSRFVDAQIDALFVTALLAILGYSVHDTIVVFDRVRENVRKNQELKLRTSFSETVGASLIQTMGRSINTSLTTFLVLVVLFFIGTPATSNFVLVLGIGILVGTYSSIFLASPLLVALANMRRK